MIEAQKCLNKARFFFEKAVTVETQDRTQFCYFFETAIVWARSVTFLLQKQYNSTPTFKDWYESQQNALQADPLAKFFKDQRNFVLKERSVSVGKVVNVTMHAHIVMEATLTVKVIRGSWRSKIRYLRQDSLRDLKQRIEKIRRRLRRRKPKREPTTAVSTEHMYFVEEPWNKEPAIDLLDRYLERLQLLVDSAAEQFTVTVENQ
ncbi:hypothetical protein ES703_38681 [subsurface metagenome]